MQYVTEYFTDDDWEQFASIFKRIQIEGEHWIWTGQVNSVTGYPMVYKRGSRKTGKTTVGPHRWLYNTMVGRALGEEPLNRKTALMRNCDVELCVNPRHYIKKPYAQLIAEGWMRKNGYEVR